MVRVRLVGELEMAMYVVVFGGVVDGSSSPLSLLESVAKCLDLLKQYYTAIKYLHKFKLTNYHNYQE